MSSVHKTKQNNSDQHTHTLATSFVSIYSVFSFGYDAAYCSMTLNFVSVHVHIFPSKEFIDVRNGGGNSNTIAAQHTATNTLSYNQYIVSHRNIDNNKKAGENKKTKNKANYMSA